MQRMPSSSRWTAGASGSRTRSTRSHAATSARIWPGSPGARAGTRCSTGTTSCSYSWEAKQRPGWHRTVRSARSLATTSQCCTGALAEGRADVDHAVVLHRHERCTEALDHSLDLREHLVIGRLHLDPDLVDRTRVKACLLQLVEQAIAVGNGCCLDLSVFSHAPALPGVYGRKTRI